MCCQSEHNYQFLKIRICRNRDSHVFAVCQAQHSQAHWATHSEGPATTTTEQGDSYHPGAPQHLFCSDIPVCTHKHHPLCYSHLQHSFSNKLQGSKPRNTRQHAPHSPAVHKPPTQVCVGTSYTVTWPTKDTLLTTCPVTNNAWAVVSALFQLVFATILWGGQ